MLISELDYKLYLHKLVFEPDLDLIQIACFDCPEPATEDTEDHTVSAIWAPAGSAVLLRYLIRDYSDDRAEFNESGFFVVGPETGLNILAPLLVLPGRFTALARWHFRLWQAGKVAGQR